MFDLVALFAPAGAQPQATAKLTAGLASGIRPQVRVGVTGAGKTFTIASVIPQLNRPLHVLSQHKTLAAQFCAKFKDFFPLCLAEVPGRSTQARTRTLHHPTP